MKIGIDARLFDESGIGRYIRNLLSELGKIDQKNEYYIFLSHNDLGSITLAKNFCKIEANIPWYTLKEQILLPKLLNKYSLDLMHFPHFNVPVAFKGKFVVTIHDLIHQHFAMERASLHGKPVYALKRLGYRLVFSHAVKRSCKIITPSVYVKNQLIKQWKVNAEKIEVTPEGVEKNILRLAEKINQTKINEALQKFGINQPFLFYVGNAHPHKNVMGLIKAFLRLKNEKKNLTLVLAGKDHYFWQKIKSLYNNEDIKYIGLISDDELVTLYKSAACYVIPSLEEGFGIPLLEAFACGCPVVCSDIEALREIGKDAAIFFNPKDVSNMATMINNLLDNEGLKKELIKKGKARYKDFSWGVLAKETLNLYGKVACP